MRAAQAISSSVPSNIFGDSSVLADGAAVYDQASSATADAVASSPVFQLLMLLCFAGYCLIMYLYRGQTWELMGMFRGKLYTEKLLDEKSRVFDSFVNYSLMLSLLSMALAASRYCDIRYAGILTDAGLPAWGFHLVPVALLILILLVFGLQYMVVRLAGWITYRQSFAAKLFYMKKVVTSVGGIVVTPVLLLTAVNAVISAQVFVYAISFCVGVVLLLLVVESYFLFVREKVSVLLWFLYLCAVEILPVATLVLLAARSI